MIRAMSSFSIFQESYTEQDTENYISCRSEQTAVKRHTTPILLHSKMSHLIDNNTLLYSACSWYSDRLILYTIYTLFKEAQSAVAYCSFALYKYFTRLLVMKTPKLFQLLGASRRKEKEKRAVVQSQPTSDDEPCSSPLTPNSAASKQHQQQRTGFFGRRRRADSHENDAGTELSPLPSVALYKNNTTTNEQPEQQPKITNTKQESAKEKHTGMSARPNKTNTLSIKVPGLKQQSPLFNPTTNNNNKDRNHNSYPNDKHQHHPSDDDDLLLFVSQEDDPIIHRILLSNHDSHHALTSEEQTRVALAVSALDQAGNDCFASGEYDAAFERYERALVLKKRALIVQEDSASAKSPESQSSPKDPAAATILASMATSINNMTYIKQRTGQATTEETMAAYVKSLQMKRDILGPDHLSVGKTLNNIGSVFYLQGSYDPALAAYKDAHRIMQAHLGADHLDVGTVVSNIGDVYVALNEPELALDYYHAALDVRWGQLGSRDPKVVRLMQQVATLETGHQPSVAAILEQHGTHDEDAELVRTMEQQCASAFLEDIHQLQASMEEDMAFFNILERQMEIDFVRERTRVFREMRDLYHSESDATEAVRKSILLVPGVTEEMMQEEDVTPKTTPITEQVPVPVQEPPSLAEAPQQQPVIKLEVVVQEQPPLQQPVNEPVVDQTNAPSCANEDAPALLPLIEVNKKPSKLDTDAPSNDQQIDAPAPLIEHATPPSLRHANRPLRNSTLDSIRTRLNSPVAASQMGPQSPATPKGHSAEERKRALEDVRARLARVRAERAARAENAMAYSLASVSENETTESRRRSYMFPTVASSAKERDVSEIHARTTSLRTSGVRAMLSSSISPSSSQLRQSVPKNYWKRVSRRTENRGSVLADSNANALLVSVAENTPENKLRAMDDLKKYAATPSPASDASSTSTYFT
jgi:tetratricopeptide (TPR) repeat protein